MEIFRTWSVCLVNTGVDIWRALVPSSALLGTWQAPIHFLFTPIHFLFTPTHFLFTPIHFSLVLAVTVLQIRKQTQNRLGDLALLT